jgi:hypothetical protein
MSVGLLPFERRTPSSHGLRNTYEVSKKCPTVGGNGTYRMVDEIVETRKIAFYGIVRGRDFIVDCPLTTSDTVIPVINLHTRKKPTWKSPT